MKILAISGGNKNGNNDAMAREALMGAKEKGAEIEFIRLLDLNIKPCTGCVACVNGMMQGKTGECIIKDDLQWLDEKIFSADGIIFVMPVFEKGSPGVMRMVQDRLFGPANDPGCCTVADMIAKKTGGPGPDPRKFDKKLMSFISIGGSQWTTRISADMNMLAMSRSWTVVDDEVFSWGKSIVMDDARVAKCRSIGENIVDAAIAGAENAEFLGDPGVCPVCHSRNFHVTDDPKETICVVCGVTGELTIKDGKMAFDVPGDQYEHAHNSMPGKMKHMDDMYRIETELNNHKATPEYKARMDKYREFIQATKP